MKQQYENPILEIINLTVQDILTESGEETFDDIFGS